MQPDASSETHASQPSVWQPEHPKCEKQALIHVQSEGRKTLNQKTVNLQKRIETYRDIFS